MIATREQPVPRGTRLWLALLFYGACAAGALIWGYGAGRPVLWQDHGASWPRVLAGGAGGLTLGLCVVALSRLAEHLGWAERLLEWFMAILGPVSWGEAFGLAALSAIGEELLFRGAMQPGWGLWLTSLLFGLAHLPPSRQLWPWTLSAGALGLAFGAAADWSGNLAAPVIAHFVINLLNLRHIGHLGELRLTEADANPLRSFDVSS